MRRRRPADGAGAPSSMVSPTSHVPSSRRSADARSRSYFRCQSCAEDCRAPPAASVNAVERPSAIGWRTSVTRCYHVDERRGGGFLSVTERSRSPPVSPALHSLPCVRASARKRPRRFHLLRIVSSTFSPLPATGWAAPCASRDPRGDSAAIVISNPSGGAFAHGPTTATGVFARYRVVDVPV